MLQHHEAIEKPPEENLQEREDCQSPDKETAQTQEQGRRNSSPKPQFGRTAHQSNTSQNKRPDKT
jgi:hypothetical protein